MNRRWHFLFMLLSIIAALFSGYFLNAPIWQIEDSRFINFDKFSEARKEWSVIVGDQDRSYWWIETRSGRDATVIRRLKLDLPPLTKPHNYYGLRESLLRNDTSDAIICCFRQRNSTPALGSSVIQHTYILDSETGKILRKFSTVDYRVGKIASHGYKVAFFEGEKLILYDLKKKTERSIPLTDADSLAFSPDGSMLACKADYNVLTLIDWDQGAPICPLSNGKYIGSFCFIANDVLLILEHSISDWGVHRRWRWNGSSLLPISPGVKLPSRTTLIDIKQSADGTLHLVMDYLLRWPTKFDSIFEWLTEKGIPVERWFPKSLHKLCVVLNNQDQILRQYYEDIAQDRGRRIKLYDQLGIDFESQEQRTIIRFWSNYPVWPNATAAGLLVYLGLYVIIRCITLNQKKPAFTP